MMTFNIAPQSGQNLGLLNTFLHDKILKNLTASSSRYTMCLGSKCEHAKSIVSIVILNMLKFSHKVSMEVLGCNASRFIEI